MFVRLTNLGLPVQRIEAVDGRALSYPIPEFCELSYRLMHGRRTCPPEVGCYLSHIECAKQFLRSDSDFALILEDDVQFESDFIETIDAAICEAKDWDILRLSTVSNGRKYGFRKLTTRRSLGIALTREKGSGAYIVNRKAATWMTTKLVPMRLAYDIAYDLEFLAGLKAVFVDPPCTTQDGDTESQIQNNIRRFKLPRWRYVTVLPYRTYLEVSRFLCRGFRLSVHRTKNALTVRKASAHLGELFEPASDGNYEGLVSPGVKPIR